MIQYAGLEPLRLFLAVKKIICLPLCLSVVAITLSCSSTHPSGLIAGAEKNSLPLMGKGRVQQVHSVTVAPFFNDNQKWAKTAYRILSSSPRISVTPFEKIEVVLKLKKKDLSDLEPENRIDGLAEVGKWLRTDAVLNGMILRHENRNELILQLISSADSRVLWWQAVDFSPREDSPRASDQQKLLKAMLGPLLSQLGQVEKSSGSIPGRTGEQSGAGQRRSNKGEIAPKSGLSTKPGQKQKPPPAEISPM